MRLYGCVHNILRLPTDVEPFELDEIAQTFRDFIIRVIMLADLWRTTWRYIFLFSRVSHSLMSHPIKVVEKPPSMPPNQ